MCDRNKRTNATLFSQPARVGSVFADGGFGLAWRSMDSWRDGSYLPQSCSTCSHVAACSGGCRVDAEQLHGDICGMETYATCEADVMSCRPQRSLEPLPPKFGILDGDLRFRDESFGVCIKRRNRDAVFVSKESAGFLRALSSAGGSFTVNETCERFALPGAPRLSFSGRCSSTEFWLRLNDLLGGRDVQPWDPKERR